MATQCIPTAGADASRAEAAATRKAGFASAIEVLRGRVTKEPAVTAMIDSSTQTPDARPGSQPVLMSEIRYGIVFGEMNEVFNSRMNSFVVFASTLAGVLSASGVVAQVTKATSGDVAIWWALALGVLSAVAYAAKVAFRFKERERDFRDAKVKFQELEGRGWGMHQSALMKEVAKLRAGAPAGGSWLASAAFNKACAELGYPDRKREMPSHIRFIAARVG